MTKLELPRSSQERRAAVGTKPLPQLGTAGFIDVETTGFSPNGHEVVELAIVLFAFNRETGDIIGIVDEYVGLREPGRSIPRDATNVHGLTMDDVRGCCLDCAAVERLIARSEFLVAHNASFDRGFVVKLFPLAAEKRWLCSMNGVNWKGKGLASKGLQQLLQAHRLSTVEAHRAEHDVKSSLQLLTQCPRGSRRSYFSELLETLEGA